jgi:hypothetical protein
MPVTLFVRVAGNAANGAPEALMPRGTPPGRTLRAEVAASEPMLAIDGIVVAVASRSAK